jgi:O-acetylserine/cysteine efflux transporter
LWRYTGFIRRDFLYDRIEKSEQSMAIQSEKVIKFVPHDDTKPIKWSDYGLILGVAVAWGLAFVGMKRVIVDAPPFEAAGIRFFISALPLLAITIWTGSIRRLKPGDFVKFAILGMFQTAILFGVAFSALQYIPAGMSSILLNTNPFFVALFAHFLVSGERLSRQKMFGLLIGFSGVLALVLGGAGVGETPLGWVMLMMVAAVAWAFSSILVKLFKFQDMVSATAWQSLFGSLPLMALGLIFEQKPINFTSSFVLWTLYLALIASSFAWWAWNRLLQRYSASRISVFLFLVPVCGVLSGVIVLGERIGLNLLIGGALVATGIIIVNLRRKATPKRETSPEIPAATTTVAYGTK